MDASKLWFLEGNHEPNVGVCFVSWVIGFGKENQIRVGLGS